MRPRDRAAAAGQQAEARKRQRQKAMSAAASGATRFPLTTGWRPAAEAGNEVAHGVLQRETGDRRALRHRGAVTSGGGPVRLECGSRGISLASEEKPAELVRAGGAHRRARRERVGPLPDREGERAR